MSGFTAGFFTAWFILSLILFLTEELTGTRYFKTNNTMYLIAVSFPVSAPVLLVCVAIKYVLVLFRYLKAKLDKSGSGWRG